MTATSTTAPGAPTFDGATWRADTGAHLRAESQNAYAHLRALQVRGKIHIPGAYAGTVASTRVHAPAAGFATQIYADTDASVGYCNMRRAPTLRVRARRTGGSRNTHPLIRYKPTRGFAEVEREEHGRGLYIREGYHLEPCPGDAHGPGGGYIDNCGVCMPLWGQVVRPDAPANAEPVVAAPMGTAWPAVDDVTGADIAALQHAAEIVARVAQTRDGAHCVVELMRCVARLRGAQ